MPEKGWLKIVLEEARKDVHSRPDWEQDRVYGCKPSEQETLKKQNRLENRKSTENEHSPAK